MKKRSALLALILAGLMSFSVLGTAACKTKKPLPDNGDNTEQGGNNPGGENPGEKPGEENPGEKPGEKPGEEEPGTVLTSDTAISLVAGEVRTLTASDGAVWNSSDATVATVNSAGVVTAKTKGVTKVTATTDGEVITCTVIVLAASESSSSGKAKDPFTFNKSIDIGSVESSGSAPVVPNPDAAEYTVTFSDGALMQNVANGGLAVEPLVENDGHFLQGWYQDSNKTIPYDFYQPVTGHLNLYAKWGDNQGLELVKGNEESIALEWTGSATEVQYRLNGSDNWTKIDEELVRENDGYVRADILGLKEGVYDVQANGKTITGIPVKAYDRSGYAHFKYDSGVGAYNNDGTLKNNALVIYVTDENKNDILGYAYSNGKKVDISNYLVSSVDSLGVTTGQQTGIGELLNNRRYSGNDRLGVGIAKLCEVYGAVAIRFIGTVENKTNYAAGSETYGKTSINGLTWYAKSGDVTPYDTSLKYAKGVAVPNGGTVNDNGSMARITNAHDVTIEGVGDDTVIQGWGFHFVSSAQNGRSQKAGSSFEVRNITFNEYPEDAIGFEGEAESKKITSPVQRCWVHNNTFLPGYCASPAESDKGEGDGSCDFKRGYYFTASYNYFEYCHKTNLIGSADDSLQFNLSYHHNIWYQCGSRIPLIRRANVHFYNNYVFGDPAQKTTPYGHISKPSLSYVHSLRASCYLLSEYNYYEGCKNILRGSEGGDGKFYNNTYYACSDAKVPVTEVDSRTQSVNNNCVDPTPTTGHDYSTFDTDPNLFYYDAENGKSNCLLDDSLSARLRAIFYAGAQGHGEITKKMQQMNTSAPVTNPSITKPTKAKGQAYVFTVYAKAVLTIDATGEDPQVIRSDGKVYLPAFSGQKQVQLDAGTYMVCSGKKDKEITINSLSVEEDTAEAKQNRIANAERVIKSIPDTITRSSGTIIDQATNVYKDLFSDAEREELADSVVERLIKAQAAYEEILVAYAIARIDYIGEVTVDSKNDIEEATKAYLALSGTAQTKVTNYDTLVEATATFAGFELDVVKFQINRLPDYTSLELVIDSKVAIELALDLYNDAYEVYSELDADDKAKIDITNINESLKVLNDAMDAIELAEQQAQNLVDFNELLESMDEVDVDVAKAGQLKALYDVLTADQKAGLTAEQKAKYDAIAAAYNDYMSKAVTIGFTSGKDNYYTNKSDYVSVSGKFTSVTEKFDGEDYTSALKFESSTTVTIKASDITRKIVLHFANGASGSIMDANNKNNVYNLDGTTVTIILEANTEITLTKKDGTKNYLFLMELLPAD